MKLIDKDAVVAEIERKEKYAQTLGDNAINGSMQQFYDGMKECCQQLSVFLDTLEVKEVDLEKNIDLVITWFEHIAQLSDDRKTLTGEVMTYQHTLDKINRLARQSAEYVKKYML